MSGGETPRERAALTNFLRQCVILGGKRHLINSQLLFIVPEGDGVRLFMFNPKIDYTHRYPTAEAALEDVRTGAYNERRKLEANRLSHHQQARLRALKKVMP